MMVQKDLNGHLDRVNLLIQLTHGQGHLNEWTLSELLLRIRSSPQWTIFGAPSKAWCF
jgi:hypothetical protein